LELSVNKKRLLKEGETGWHRGGREAEGGRAFFEEEQVRVKRSLEKNPKRSICGKSRVGRAQWIQGSIPRRDRRSSRQGPGGGGDRTEERKLAGEIAVGHKNAGGKL